MYELKNTIEKLSTNEQKEIFNIVKKNNEIKYTQNSNGVFLLMNNLDEDTVKKINLFLKYLDDSKQQTQIMEERLSNLNNIKN